MEMTRTVVTTDEIPYMAAVAYVFRWHNDPRNVRADPAWAGEYLREALQIGWVTQGEYDLLLAEVGRLAQMRMEL